LTASEVDEQHPLYIATKRPCRKPVDLCALLYCRLHRCPLIECHDRKEVPF